MQPLRRKSRCISVMTSDEQAFTAFVREHGAGLLRFARWLIPDAGDAEDALQTALLRLTSQWPKDNPGAYVRAALVNLAKDRARRSHLVAVPTSVESPERAVDERDDAAEAQARLDEVLNMLPPRQRVTVVLRVLEGLSEAETAQCMGCSTGTVKSNLARGLDKARHALTSHTAISTSIQESQ